MESSVSQATASLEGSGDHAAARGGRVSGNGRNVDRTRANVRKLPTYLVYPATARGFLFMLYTQRSCRDNYFHSTNPHTKITTYAIE